MTSITWQTRNFFARTAPAGLDFTVKRYSWAAVGGPKEAVIEARGGLGDMARLMEWIRCPVTIYNDNGAAVWWGCVQKVEVPLEGMTLTADIDEMYNRVAVAYTTVGVGQSTTGARGTTAWVEDADAIAEYGKRELLDSRGGATLTHAEIIRDRILQTHKFPKGSPARQPSLQNNPVTLITCCGWWNTLEWQYGNVPASLAFAHQVTSGAEQTIGATDVIAVAQSFTSGPTAWNVQEIGLIIKRVGTPSANLAVAVCASTGGWTPGSALASTTIDITSVGTAYSWVHAAFTTPQALAASTTYVITATASGLDASNYYAMALDGGLTYPGGVMSRKIGGSWGNAAADMPFQIYTNELSDNAQQVRNLLTLYGQFFRAVHAEAASGIVTESYRNGDSDALYEIQELLDTGTTAGLRLLAVVDPFRNARVFEEPSDDGKHYLEKDGHFYQYSNRIEDDTCPCGFWARLRNVVPSSLDTSRLSGLDTFFVESAQYDVGQKRLTFEPYVTKDKYDIGLVVG